MQEIQALGAGDQAAGAPEAALRVTWTGGSRFDAGRPGRPVQRMDGDGIAAPSPFDTFLSAIAGCAATDVVLILRKQRTPVESLEVQVEAGRVREFPGRLESLRLVFRITGQGITRPQAERAVELAVTKYCSVRSSLAGDVAVSWQVVL